MCGLFAAFRQIGRAGFVCYATSMTLSPELVHVNTLTGCWEWVGPRNAEDYGLCMSQLAHRVVYTLFKGPIPEGLTLDHLCRLKPCVNPDHLEAVTVAENNSRKPVRSRAVVVPPVSPVTRYVTPAEAAQAYQVDVKTVSRWAKSGRIGFIQTPGGHRRYALNSDLTL